jgi:hypothetical protein
MKNKKRISALCLMLLAFAIWGGSTALAGWLFDSSCPVFEINGEEISVIVELAPLGIAEQITQENPVQVTLIVPEGVEAELKEVSGDFPEEVTIIQMGKRSKIWVHVYALKLKKPKPHPKHPKIRVYVYAPNPKKLKPHPKHPKIRVHVHAPNPKKLKPHPKLSKIWVHVYAPNLPDLERMRVTVKDEEGEILAQLENGGPHVTVTFPIPGD